MFCNTQKVVSDTPITGRMSVRCSMLSTLVDLSLSIILNEATIFLVFDAPYRLLRLFSFCFLMYDNERKKSADKYMSLNFVDSMLNKYLVEKQSEKHQA